MNKIAMVMAVSLLGACSQMPFGNTTSNQNAMVQPDLPVDPANDPTSAEFFAQTIGDRVLFDVDQHQLNDAGKAVLASQAAWLRENASFQIVIEGHADEQGTREYNLALGARRARAVQEYFLSAGIGAERMRTRSFGKERPIEICSEESCYAQNRRAVTVLIGDAATS